MNHTMETLRKRIAEEREATRVFPADELFSMIDSGEGQQALDNLAKMCHIVHNVLYCKGM